MLILYQQSQLKSGLKQFFAIEANTIKMDLTRVARTLLLRSKLSRRGNTLEIEI